MACKLAIREVQLGALQSIKYVLLNKDRICKQPLCFKDIKVVAMLLFL